MITRLIYLTVSLGVSSAAWANDPAPECRTSEVKTAGYHLKNQSAFEVAPGVRAPFWPIGWTPSAKTTQNDAVAPNFVISPDQFSVTSILLGSQSLAVINGRTYGEGEFLKTPRAPARAAEGALPTNAAAAPGIPAGLKVRVNRIIDGQVILQAGGQAISVP